MGRLNCILHPKPELARFDTGLRYTDILFGFVIIGIFTRLQYWQNLDRYAWLYLSVCLALVLGSWIGYRRSLNRSAYEVKFFNLPFFRFLLDQAMLILYLQVVNSTVVDPTKPWTDASANLKLVTDPTELANRILGLLGLIFLLYLLWDILGMRMAGSKMPIMEVDANGREQRQFIPRYADATKDNVKDNELIDPRKEAKPDKRGFVITLMCLFLIGGLWLNNNFYFSLVPGATFIIMVVLLVGYRLAKEARMCF